MKIRFFLIFLIFLLAGSSVSSIVSGLTKTGQYEGSFDVDVGDIIIITGDKECYEDWSCSYWTACSGNRQSFVCIDCNACGTYSLRPQTCGSTRTCGSTTNTGGGGGGGGGGSGCTENWQCGEWSSCISGKQTRTCTDLKDCGTTYYKPATTRVCTQSAGLETDSKGKVTLINDSNSDAATTSGITGAVIGALKDKRIIVVTSFIIGILALSIALLVVRRKKDAKIVEKVNDIMKKK